MEKININDLHSNIDVFLDQTQAACIYKTKDNRIFKYFDQDFLSSLCERGYDFESKILNASELIDVPEIVIPDSAVYDDEVFLGYTMPYFEGMSIYAFIDYNKHNLSLKGLNPFFMRLESIIKKTDNIIFPDLLSDGNILVNKTDIGLIDFDGLQIGEYLSPALSSSLGERLYYDNTKYRDGILYTKQLDIKSLIYLYFDLVFDCPLWEVDKILLNSGEDKVNERLEFLFHFHNIDSSDLFDKVSRLYDNDVENLYLGDTIFDIASNYELNSDYYDLFGVRKLVKKKK